MFRGSRGIKKSPGKFFLSLPETESPLNHCQFLRNSQLNNRLDSVIRTGLRPYTNAYMEAPLLPRPANHLSQAQPKGWRLGGGGLEGGGALKAPCNLEPLSSGISSSACVIRRRESAEHLIRLIVIPAGALRRDTKYIFTPALQAKEEHRACARENWPEKKWNDGREDKVLSFSERKGKQKAAEKNSTRAGSKYVRELVFLFAIS